MTHYSDRDLITGPPVPKDIFTQRDLEPAFRESIRRAEANFFIESAYISVDGVKRFANDFANAVARSVVCCAFVEKPEDWDRRDDPRLDPARRAELRKIEAAGEFVRALGMHFTMREGTHLKLAVFDYKTTYGGSLNILSYTGRKDDEAWRWHDPAWAMATVKRRKWDDCGVCSNTEKTPRDQVFLSPDAKVLGHSIADLRKLAGLSQEQLAQLVGIRRETLSNIETGKVQVRSELLVQIFAAVDRCVVALPPGMMPIVQAMMRTDGRL